MIFNSKLSREDVLKRLKMRFVATIGTKGTIRGCTLSEAINLFKRDWAENINDYVRYLNYKNLHELIEKELCGSVRIVRDKNCVRYCAIASPDLEHCFRFIDHPQLKQRNPLSGSLHFSPEQQAMLRGQSCFSRSQSRRPPPPSPGVRRSTPRLHTPVYTRQAMTTESNTEQQPASQTVSHVSHDSSLSHTQSMPSIAYKEDESKVVITSFFTQIFDSMTISTNDRRTEPFTTEIEKSSTIQPPVLDAVNRKTYSSDDALLGKLDAHYSNSDYMPEESHAVADAEKCLEKMNFQIQADFFRFEDIIF